jgi:hypothetical protein
MSTTFSLVRLIKGPITVEIRSAGRSESLKGQEHGWCQVSARGSQGLNYTIIKSIIYPILFFSNMILWDITAPFWSRKVPAESEELFMALAQIGHAANVIIIS